MAFDTGYYLDSNHLGKWGGALLAVAVGVGTYAAGMMLEVVNQYLPDTEGSLMETMAKMMEGPLWVNEPGSRHCHFRHILRRDPRQYLAGGDRFRDRLPLRICLLSHWFPEAYHPDALCQQHDSGPYGQVRSGITQRCQEHT